MGRTGGKGRAGRWLTCHQHNPLVLLHELAPTHSTGRVSTKASSARTMPALTRNLGLKDVSRVPRTMVSCLGEMFLQQGAEPIARCHVWGISQSMLKHKQEPLRQRLGGIGHKKVLTWLGRCRQF